MRIEASARTLASFRNFTFEMIWIPSIESILVLLLCVWTPVDAMKQLSWLGANQLLVRQGNQNIPEASALAELNGLIYAFGSSNSLGSKCRVPSLFFFLLP